jgi:membrane-associated phospholipid phosphatase
MVLPLVPPLPPGAPGYFPALWITDIGDGAVMAPLGLILTATLARIDRGAAGLWLVSAGSCVAIILTLKILYYLGMFTWGNPSGHVAMTVLVLGSAARIVPLFARGAGVPATRAGLALVVVGVAVSRVLLGAHSWREVAAGMALGAVAAGVQWFRPSAPAPARSVRLAPLVALVAVLATYGHVLPAERMIVATARALAPDLGRVALR